MNNAATSWPKPDRVAGAMAGFLRSGGANLSRGSAAKRDISTLDMVTTCRDRAASMMGGYRGGDSRYVTFTHNVTYALNMVLKGYCRPGMRVLTTSMEHNAVVRPLRSLEAQGVRLEVLPCSREGFLEETVLRPALEEGADLVVLSHASNITGSIQDMEMIASLCAEAGVPLVLDAAQTAGEIPLTAEAWGLAALTFTGHKGLMGPQGIGGTLWKPGFHEQVRPLVEGGTGSYSHEERQPEVMPDKFESGTPNLPGLAGFLAALDWIEEQGIDTIHRRRRELGARLLEGLLAMPAVTLFGPRDMERRLPVFALDMAGWDNGLLAYTLSEEYGIETRPGLHCAPLAHRTVGSFPQGALRLSPGYFTTAEDIDSTVDALRACAARGGR